MTQKASAAADAARQSRRRRATRPNAAGVTLSPAARPVRIPARRLSTTQSVTSRAKTSGLTWPSWSERMNGIVSAVATTRGSGTRRRLPSATSTQTSSAAPTAVCSQRAHPVLRPANGV